MKTEYDCTDRWHKHQDPEVVAVPVSVTDVPLQFCAATESDCAPAIPLIKAKHPFENLECGHMVHNDSSLQQPEVLHQCRGRHAADDG